MKRHFLTSVSAAALLALGSGVGVAAEPPLSVDWDGWYVGGHIGGGAASFRTIDLHDGDGAINTSPSGLVGGVQVGRNWQMDTFVLGLEADLSATGWSQNKTFAPADSSRAVDNKVSLLASLRARLGIPFDHRLIYVTGGLAYTQGKYLAISPGGTLNPGTHNAFGGVVGLGVDWMRSENFNWRFEGLYYLFDDGITYAGTDNPSGRSEYRHAWVARLAVNYHLSDIRLKRDIALLARRDDGIGLYRYRYFGSDRAYVGVMAQEVLKIRPDAVARGSDGFLRVDYARLGLRLMTWREWAASSQAGLPVAA